MEYIVIDEGELAGPYRPSDDVSLRPPQDLDYELQPEDDEMVILGPSSNPPEPSLEPPIPDREPTAGFGGSLADAIQRIRQMMIEVIQRIIQQLIDALQSIIDAAMLQLSAPVDISDGVVNVATFEDEIKIYGAGASGLKVPVNLNGFEPGEMTLIGDPITGYSTPAGTSAFLKMNSNPLSTYFGDAVQLGVQVDVLDNELIVGAAVRIGDDGPMLTFDDIAAIASHITIPGMSLGDDFANLTFLTSFSEGGLNFELLNIPVVMGQTVQGHVNLGWVGGAPAISGQLLVEVSPGVVGIVELSEQNGQFSGSGSVQFVHGDIFGDLEISFGPEGLSGTGTGGISTSQFTAEAAFIFGNKMAVNQWVHSQLGQLHVLNGTENQHPTDINPEKPSAIIPDASTEWAMAGSLTGTIPLSHSSDGAASLNASATGIVDSDGDYVLHVGLAEEGTLNLTDLASGDFGIDEKYPLAGWGVPGFNVTADLEFGLEFSYDVGPLQLIGASADGLYSSNPAKYGVATGIDLQGTISMDDKISLTGKLGAGVVGSLAGSSASIFIEADLTAQLDGNTTLEADIGVDMGPQGLHPHFAAKGEISQALTLFLKGKLVTDIEFNAWVAHYDKHWEHSFLALEFPVGEIDLEAIYNSDGEDPFQFGAPDGGKVFKVTNWEDLITALHGDGSKLTQKPGHHGLSKGDVEVPSTLDAPTEFTDAQLNEALNGVRVVYINPDAETHELIIELHSEDLQLWRHSESPSLLEEYVLKLVDFYTDKFAQTGDSKDQDAINTLEVMLVEVESEEWMEKARVLDKSRTNKPTIYGPEAKPDVKLVWDELQEYNEILKELDTRKGPIPTAPDWSPDDPSVGQPTGVVIEKLHTTQDRRHQGKEASAWRYVKPSPGPDNDAVSSAKNWLEERASWKGWVAYHIIHFALGGKSDKSNLIPVLGTTNQDYESFFERNMISLVNSGEVVWLETKTDYHGKNQNGNLGEPQGDAARAFPNSFTAEGGVMDWNGTDWVRGPKLHNFSASPDLPSIPLNTAFNVNDTAEYNTNTYKEFKIDYKVGEYLRSNRGGQNYTDDLSDVRDALDQQFPNKSFPKDITRNDLKAIGRPVAGGLLSTLIQLNSSTLAFNFKQIVALLTRGNRGGIIF
jgi:hypothetical protein